MHPGGAARTTAIAVFVWAVGSTAQQHPARVDFARQIQPILERSCYACHGPKQQMAKLRLDSKAAAFTKVVVAGNSAESPLYQRVAGIGGVVQMPMGGKLAPAEIELIRTWIDQGAEWPGDVSKHWAFV